MEHPLSRPADADRPTKRPSLPLKSEEQVLLEYEAKNNYFADLSRYFQLDLVEVDCREFISCIFERRVGYQSDIVPFEDRMSKEYQLWLEQKTKGEKQIDYKGYACWRYNPIVFYSEGRKKGRHRVLLKDDEDTLSFLEGRRFALMAPITYVGRTNSSVNARYLYALGFDLDGIGIKQIRALMRMMVDDYIPMANLITNSGHGLHLYYLLEQPVPLYKENLHLLNKLKHGLTNIIWNDKTSTIEDRQHQSVLQGFRLPGTLTKFQVPVKSYYNADAHMYSIERLNAYLSEFRITDAELKQLTQAPCYNPTGITIDEAERRFPEWYASVVLNHKRVGKKWHVKRDVYDWWFEKLMTADKEIKVHHRYWCILTLIVYAVKCDIPREEVLADAYSLVPKLDTYTEEEDNHFTEDDVNDAMKAYDENYNKWPIHTIETTTLFHIERNRRNRNNQLEHLKMARMLQKMKRERGNKGDWNGRKPKFEAVKKWMDDNPGVDNKSLCARDTGLSRPTIIKWWSVIENERTGISSFHNTKQQGGDTVAENKHIVFLDKLFAPNSIYTVDGFTHDELVAAVTSGKLEKMGWKLVIS